MPSKKRIPRRAKEDKSFPFVKRTEETSPKAYKRYIRKKRFEPIADKWPAAKRCIGKILLFVSGIVAALIAQWLIKVFGLD